MSKFPSAVMFPIVVALIVAAFTSVSGYHHHSQLPRNHLQSAFRQIRHMQVLPPNSVVLDSVPSVQVSSFKVDDYSGRSLNLRNLLGYDIPLDVINKLETRVQTIRF